MKKGRGKNKGAKSRGEYQNKVRNSSLRQKEAVDQGD